MKGFSFSASAGTFTFGDGDRDALVVPSGRMLQVLPDEVAVDNNDRAYPDMPKAGARLYTYVWSITRVIDAELNNHYSHVGTGRVLVSVTPQAYSLTGVIAAVPAGCDFFEGRIKVTRTVAPSHNWLGSAFAVLCPQDKWINAQFVPLEAGLGFIRVLHVYISGANLIWHMQQSLGAAPGGYGNHPGNPGGVPGAVSGFGSFPADGGETVHNGTAGWPAYYGGETPPFRKVQAYTDDTDVFGNPSVPQAHRMTGSDPPTTTDPTNFGATWRFTLRGRFGRRT